MNANEAWVDRHVRDLWVPNRVRPLFRDVDSSMDVEDVYDRIIDHRLDRMVLRATLRHVHVIYIKEIEYRKTPNRTTPPLNAYLICVVDDGQSAFAWYSMLTPGFHGNRNSTHIRCWWWPSDAVDFFVKLIRFTVYPSRNRTYNRLFKLVS